MSATSIELKAPAKLNLFLHVVGRRTDGMHLLESVFVLIDLCDDIVLELDPSGKISRTGDVIGDMDKDLCVRAARRLQQISGNDRMPHPRYKAHSSGCRHGRRF